MSCDRANDIDVRAFLADPRATRFEEFAQHLDGCAECRAEVSDWLALSEALDDPAQHPTPHQLAAFEGNPESLTGDELVSVSDHLQSCVACQGEVRSLRTHRQESRGGVATSTAVGAAGALERLWRGITGVLWHPAFAYSIALVALVFLTPNGAPVREKPDASAASIIWRGSRTATSDRKDLSSATPLSIDDVVIGFHDSGDQRAFCEKVCPEDDEDDTLEASPEDRSGH